MRWLVIDEISQVGAELLAGCEANVRAAVQAAGTYKVDPISGDTRPWAGINVIYVGDFKQLPPTKATPLTTLPPSLLDLAGIVNPRVQHGLELFWSDTTHYVELEDQVRCVDPWWQTVLDELRDGRMTADTHAFLHGLPTAAPGSWLHGRAQCGNEACTGLGSECEQCSRERKRRCRLYKGALYGEHDKRFHDPKFRNAIHVVPTNDLKMETCKLAAAQFARDHGQCILWSRADDRVVSSCGLLDDDNLRAKKINWLSRHDKECGSLFGWLPLVRGMPIYLTNHIDRSSKALLRGRSGTLLDWELDPEEPPVPSDCDHYLKYLPRCVYVQFEDEGDDGVKVSPEWNVASMQNGVYCISPKPEYWCLDSKANRSHMRIRRHQLPIAPDFARTAYSLQGFTLPVGKVDLNLGTHSDPVTGYVALSRFKKADDVLILQAVDLETFQQGAAELPMLLQQHLSTLPPGSNTHGPDFHGYASREEARKENERAEKRKRANESRAQAVKRAHSSQRVCVVCGLEKNKDQYTPHFWKQKEQAKCKDCVAISRTVQCRACGERKEKTEFTDHQRKQASSICRSCAAMVLR